MSGAGPVRILSLDGGPGTFLAIRILIEMERLTPGFIDKIDLFAGTSSGGMAALYLAKHLVRGQIASHLAVLEACRDFIDAYAQALGVRWLGLRALLRPSRPLTERRPYQRFVGILRGAFGDDALDDLDRKVLIMSFDSEPWAPFAFRNFWGDDQASKRHYSTASLVDVALATSAFPPLVPIRGRVGRAGAYHGYLDGYLAANSPVMSAVTLALRDLCGGDVSRLEVVSLGGVQSYEEAHLEHTGGVIANLVMLFGRRRALRQLSWITSWKSLVAPGVLSPVTKAMTTGFGAAEQGRWGWLDLAKRPTLLPNMALHGATREIDRQCRRLLGKRYHRVALRMNVISSMFNIAIGNWAFVSGTFDRAARRALGEHVDHADAPSIDDDTNYNSVRSLRRWIRKILMVSTTAPLLAPAKAPPRERARTPKAPAPKAPRPKARAHARAKDSTT